MAELMITVVFWGLWTYLVTPLLSLGLWYLGITLFIDRMITLGGYETFAEQLVNYGLAVFVMWLLLTLWVTWNLRRYGERNRRNVRPSHVTKEQMAEAMQLSLVTIQKLITSRVTYLHFDKHELPVIEKTSSGR
ncbi:MAG: poly-beta-1,6-N-acetyl-D-glucosamine biosynthesis protein PgaD [Gammaproteobacteria bacterium]|nr:poly-beta-1,6-N-acetyl-D-glucosamine biosynthesis protein PgaD [Gammaproteobacteria bacterium]